MFLDNKYTKAYYKIIRKAKNRFTDEEGYYETHHIKPKSLGGTDDAENLVDLTAREHFVVHRLLVKMTEGEAKSKMVWALWRLANHKIEVSSRHYEAARKVFAENIKKMNSRPKTDAEKEAMRGKRPHVNQTGSANNNNKGSYVTPWGTFDSISSASENSPMNMTMGMIVQYCKYKVDKVIYKTNKYGLERGKTPRELGFGFIEKGLS